jgi:integrase
METQIPVDLLVHQLQQIPGIKVSVEKGPNLQTALSDGITFKEWALRWLEVYKRGIVKDNTFYGTYREPVEKYLIPNFGDCLLSSIHPEDIQIYFKSLADELSLETQKKLRNALKQIFDTAIESGYCGLNPVTRSLRLTSNVKPAEKHTWSEEEYQTAYQFALHHPCGLDIITLMETAITRSELLGLHWEDLNPAQKTLHIRHGLVSQKSSHSGKYELVNDGLKNKYRQRCIPLSPLLNGLLSLKPKTITLKVNQTRETQKVRTKFIFHGPTGGPYDPNNWYRRVLHGFMRDLHEEYPEVRMLTTHELRHTRATLLKDEGTDIFSISRLLGHCDLNMLAKRYAHDNVEALRKALGL